MGLFDAIGSAVGAGLAYEGVKETNQANKDINNANNTFSAQQADINRNFQERMSDSQYQRQMADMRLAGLNPILAASNGGGAGTPSGSAASAGPSPTFQNPMASAVSSAQSVAQTANSIASADLTRQLALKASAETKSIDVSSAKNAATAPIYRAAGEATTKGLSLWDKFVPLAWSALSAVPQKLGGALYNGREYYRAAHKRPSVKTSWGASGAPADWQP